MEYFTLLDLNKEPFSNSPDPEMFYESTQHQGCLQKIELSIRLKRGLSVVIGDIGTGKSTVCRHLLRRINSPNDKILAHLFLDPDFSSPLEFLTTICKLFHIDDLRDCQSEWKIKEGIKNFLFDQAVENNHITVLILDEGQKIPGFCIEILREFLNYETNKHKLIQIVIFAQNEFDTMLRQKPNFADRITTFHRLTPLNFKDTRQMIQFRLDQANKNSGPSPKLFTPLATFAIYLISKGYPRRIVMLCSKIIIAILVKNKKKSDLLDVLACARETSMFFGASPIKAGAFAVLIAVVISVVSIAGVNTYSKKINAMQSISHIKPAAGEPSSGIQTEIISALKPVIISYKEPQSTRFNHPEQRKPFDFTTQDYEKIPDFLGTVEYDNQVLLSKMIAFIYGRYKTVLLQKILMENPHITNPNRVAKNTLINFPKDIQQRFIPRNGEFWIELTKVASLAEAYAVAKEIPESEPPVRIVPVAQDTSSLVFFIIIDKSFQDKQSAKDEIMNMSKKLQKSAIIRQA